MKKRKLQVTQYRTFVLAICSMVIIAALMYANIRIAVASPGGVDFLTHWVGTRALFHGESPYSDEVAMNVQEIVYGRPAQFGENQFLDPYLIHMEIVFAPFALIPNYEVARAAWMTLLELSTAAIFILSVLIVGWKPKVVTFMVYLIYCLFGYHSIRPILNGNVTTVVTLLIVGAIWALQNRKDHIAGLLMAFALAKPNLTVLPAALLILWTIGSRRWRFIAWFFCGFSLLALAGMVIIPDWPAQNLSTILRYTSYNPPTTIAAALDGWFPRVGRWMAVGIYAVITIVLIREWIRISRESFDAFLPVFCLTLVGAQWLWISTDPGNFILLTLPLTLVLKSIDQLKHGSAWNCILLSVLLIGLWVLFLLTVDYAHGNLQNPIMFFPLPSILIIGLYLRGLKIRPRNEAAINLPG